ncbi:MAG: hypothetical protein K2X93_11120, partial [Candidatus Obscuribacterales bacterium]|nr:hypothetical protein [Candidatus Obscuribacterales bacterium]
MTQHKWSALNARVCAAFFSKGVLMYSKVRKPLSFLLASSVIALSMPLGALAAVTASAQAGGVELPIN